MHVTNSLINTLREADDLQRFVHSYAQERRIGHQLQGLQHTSAAQEALKHYIREMTLLGIDITTIIDIERKVHARHKMESSLRAIWSDHLPYEIIAVDCGLQANDWHLWLSNPRDEWAGEFWDMIDYPERAIPGAWAED